MKYEQTIVRVPKKLIEYVNHYLSLPLGLDSSEYQGEDNTIVVATVKCDNGYEIDIKCCGCQEEASWTEAVLFNENGAELCCTECSDEILGEWTLEYNDTIYSVIIEEETKHYVILCDWAVDQMGESGVTISSVAHTLEEAKETFARVSCDEKQYAKEHGWTVYADTDTEFDAGEEGYYEAEHTHFYIQEVE